MQHTEETRKEAREFYIRAKVRDLSRLSKLTGISRVTLRNWRDEEEWDKTADVMEIDPQAVLQMYLRLEAHLLREIADLELAGKIPADSTLERQGFYRKQAQSIAAQYDISGAILRFAEAQIDFYSGLPDFQGKTEFIAVLDKYLGLFMDYIIHGKHPS